MRDNCLIRKIEELVSERLRPVAAERGGDLRVETIADGVVIFEISGSPGATISLRPQITSLIRHYVRGDLEVEFRTTDSRDVVEDRSVFERVSALLEDRINPAISAHNGKVQLSRIEKDVAYIRLEGGCQGCAMAEVTVRQGVEVLIREAVPEIISVVDETDHALGTQPFFKTKKGA